MNLMKKFASFYASIIALWSVSPMLDWSFVEAVWGVPGTEIMFALAVVFSIIAIISISHTVKLLLHENLNKKSVNILILVCSIGLLLIILEYVYWFIIY